MIRSDIFSRGVIRVDGRFLLRWRTWGKTSWDGKSTDGVLGAAWTEWVGGAWGSSGCDRNNVLRVRNCGGGKGEVIQ